MAWTYEKPNVGYFTRFIARDQEGNILYWLPEPGDSPPIGTFIGDNHFSVGTFPLLPLPLNPVEGQRVVLEWRSGKWVMTQNTEP